MKPIVIFGIFIMILVFAQAAQAQTVDDIIEKHIAAMGGKDKLATLNSFRMEGGMTVQGTDVAITITKLNGVGARTEISVAGTENYRVVTATKGIVFMPVFGQSSPEDMPADQLKSEQVFLDLHGVFVNYKEKGIQPALGGKETVDGMECYKIKVTFKEGNVTNFFIDTKTYRLYKTTTTLNANGEATESFTIYTNYKQTPDGYWFAYTTANSRGQTDFDKVETNIKVDPNIFN